MIVYTASDLAMDIVHRKSVTSVIYEYTIVTFTWKTNKQHWAGNCTNNSKIRAMFEAIKRLVFRRTCESFGIHISHSTPRHKDNIVH